MSFNIHIKRQGVADAKTHAEACQQHRYVHCIHLLEQQQLVHKNYGMKFSFLFLVWVQVIFAIVHSLGHAGMKSLVSIRHPYFFYLDIKIFERDLVEVKDRIYILSRIKADK